MEIVYKIHGDPRLLLSDRAQVFTSNFRLTDFLVWVNNCPIDRLTIQNIMEN
jgi:hypothetical protein